LKKNKISKNWIRKQHKDPFFKQSKIEGYRSRSAYKLIEINEKFKFLKKNSYLLDLGSSPGGWAQVASKKVLNGKILCIDTKMMEKINKVFFINGDLNDELIHKKIYEFFNKKIDIVISDMAANTTGNKDLDSYKTGQLALIAMNIALKILNKDGVFLSKVFMGSIFDEIQKKANKHFKKVVKYKPLSSRQESKEIYIFCKSIS
tara:strand:- start:233 stop:844 length:612 start_codon:yes stop_codon:yes gene_type:complete